jgi:hypothetical protein
MAEGQRPVSNQWSVIRANPDVSIIHEKFFPRAYNVNAADPSFFTENRKLVS